MAKIEPFLRRPNYLSSKADYLGSTCRQVIFDVGVVLVVVRFGHQHFDIPPDNFF